MTVEYRDGRPEPLALEAETVATGDRRAALEFVRGPAFDFRPGKIVEALDILPPLYRRTTKYGHFGRPGLPWEA